LLDRALDNIFGANFDFIPKTGDDDLNKQVKDYIDERMLAENCDAAGVMDFVDMAKTALRAIWNDGDQLLVKKGDGSLIAFESDQVGTPTGGDTKGKRVVQGVELNEFNRPTGYWVKQRNTTSDHGNVDSSKQYKRVSAKNAIFPAFRKRAGQSRGLSFLAALLGTFERANNYLDFEQFAAEQNSMFGWKIKKKPDDTGDLSGMVDNTDGETDDVWDKMQKMTQGLMLELEPDEDVEMFGAERPGNNFTDYIVMCCRIIGVGIGYPLELLLLDFSKTNYSSGRMALSEAKRMFRTWQRFGKTKICLPWYKWQIDRGIASGELPARSELYNVRLQWPGWEMVDKLKEAKGDDISILNRTKSRSSCIRDRGEEPREVFEEIAAETLRLKELGLIEEKSSTGKASEEVARGVRAGIPIGIKEARVKIGLPAEAPEDELLRFNDQDVLQYHVEAGILTINEIRAVLGLEKVGWGNVPVRKTGVAPVVEGGSQQEADSEEEEVEEVDEDDE
jgi:lambda family phage portal protein